MVNENALILKGNIVYAKEDKSLQCMPDGYVVCVENRCRGVYARLPEKYAMLPVRDYGTAMILPGMTDLHVHASQYTFRGIGMDLELLEWLGHNTFPEEAKYKDLVYAKSAYQIFVEDMRRSFTTRACIFATLHKEATIELMDQLEASGLITFVGKVNMDRNGTVDLCEPSAKEAALATRDWLTRIRGRYLRTYPILTPRFIPSCTDELMLELQKIQREYGLHVQSHLSENLSEVAWVKELVPAAPSYAGAYDMFGLLGSKLMPAIMAHCVYCTKDERSLMKQRGVYVAHCPESNLNLASGIAPIRRYLEDEIPVGLGTDIAAGSSISMAKAITLSIQASKMYYRLIDTTAKPLNVTEAFYLATLGGGSFFGKAGTFLDDYEFDAVVVDDSKIKSMRKLTLEERLERLFYQESECRLIDKYVCGTRIG